LRAIELWRLAVLAEVERQGGVATGRGSSESEGADQVGAVVKRSCREVVASHERGASPVLAMGEVLGLGVRARDGSAVVPGVEVIAVGQVMKDLPRAEAAATGEVVPGRAAAGEDDDTAAA